MTLPVVWIPEADADLKEALAWYGAIHPDLALRFVMAVESAVETIAEHPQRFQVVHKQMRARGFDGSLTEYFSRWKPNGLW